MKSNTWQRYEKFARLVADARREAGLSQQEVAERMDKPQTFVSRCERGTRRMDVIEFFAFAEAIGVEPLQLLKTLK